MASGRSSFFDAPPPATRVAWARRAAQIRRRLRACLGDLPPLRAPRPKILCRERRDGFVLERFAFDNGAGATVYGSCALPERIHGRAPAILYHHYHGMEYGLGKEEILRPGPAGTSPAAALTRAGYVVLAIDAYAFGERSRQGPAGRRESGRATEHALFKAFLWEGRTLWGMMVRDDRLALSVLRSRPEVDPSRIGATGMSMGSTRTWWLAALDRRVKAAVGVACLTRYQDLLRRGELRQHGFYYFVPGLLRAGIDSEQIVGLIAPRPFLALTGDRDAGSPAEGVRKIHAFARRVYGLYGARDRFRGVLHPGVGHVWTRAMWGEMEEWFRRHL